MLELGNKRKGDIVYKDFFQSIGFEHTSVDLNGKDGALPLDLSKPLGLGTFDMVTNLGTSEHVSEGSYTGQVECWRNIVEAMHIGSVLVSITPQPGTWIRHGTWYPKLDFFTQLAQLNGLEVERLRERPWFDDKPDQRLVTVRLVRREVVPFQMPPSSSMYRNHY